MQNHLFRLGVDLNKVAGAHGQAAGANRSLGRGDVRHAYLPQHVRVRHVVAAVVNPVNGCPWRDPDQTGGESKFVERSFSKLV